MAGATRRARLADLKSEIARLERVESTLPKAQARLFSLGADAVDGLLPEAGLARGALHDVSAVEERDRPAAQGFLTALVARLWLALGPGERRPVLWIDHGYHAREFGRLYGPGLIDFGLDPTRFVFATAKNVPDLLWAMEEGAKCESLSAVVGTLGEEARAFDLTASRRLQLAAERSGVSLFTLRAPKDRGQSAARTRWRIAAQPSSRPDWQVNWAQMSGLNLQNHGIGHPRWKAALEKCRGGPPRVWDLEWDYATLCFRLAASVADRQASARPEAGAEVIALRQIAG